LRTCGYSIEAARSTMSVAKLLGVHSRSPLPTIPRRPGAPEPPFFLRERQRGTAGPESAIERSKALARRKELYEALHPETRQGATPGNKGGNRGKIKTDNVSGLIPSFAADTAAATGQSERQVRRDDHQAHRPDGGQRGALGLRITVADIAPTRARATRNQGNITRP